MNELLVTLGDQSYRFGAGETVRIGRSPDNDIVVSDPTVSRRHAELRPASAGWEFENVGRALSFLDGAPVTRVRLDGSAQIQLSSTNGPILAVTVSDVAGPGPATAAATAVAQPAPGRPGGPAVSAYQGDPHQDSDFQGDSFQADPAWPDYQQPGYQRAPSQRPEHQPGGSPQPDYQQAEYPQAEYPQPDYQQAEYQQPEYQQPEYPQGEFPQGGLQHEDYLPLGRQASEPSGYRPPDFEPDLFRPDAAAVPPLPVLPSVDPPSEGSAQAEPAGPGSPAAADGPSSGFPDSGDALGGFPSAGYQPEYGGQAQSGAQPGAQDQPGYPSSPDYLSQPDFPAQPEFSAQADYLGQPGSPDQPDYLGQSGSPSQPSYPGRPPAVAEPEASAPDRTSVMGPPPGIDGIAGPDGASPGSTGAGSAYPGPAGYPPANGYPGTGYPAAGHPYPDYSGDAQPGQEVPRIRQVGTPPVDEIATALHILVPIRSWLHDPGWRQFLRLLVIPYGLLPLIFIALFASSSNLATPGWAYSLYIAPLWAIAFWLLIRPGSVERQEALIGVGAIAFSLVWIRVITVHVNDLMGPPGKPLSFPGAIGVGLNEEITKALPILLAALLLLKYRSTKLDVRMWMFLGTIVGLAFGVTEQAGYTLQDIQGITAAQANSQAIVEVLAFAERVFVDGFQHAMWAGVSAFFIGMAVNYPRRRFQLIAFGIALPAVLHGLYDWSAGAFSSLWIPIIIQALSLFLFLGYTMSAAAIERQVRRTPMFRGESMLMERISGISDRPGHAQSGHAQSGHGQSGHGQSSHGQSSQGQSSDGYSGHGDTGRARHGAAPPAEGAASPWPAPQPPASPRPGPASPPPDSPWPGAAPADSTMTESAVPPVQQSQDQQRTADGPAGDESPPGDPHPHWAGLRKPPE
jgi:RsiW-degrading membrane proteinase PrsW (M82 family)